MKVKILVSVLLTIVVCFGVYTFIPTETPPLNVNEVAQDPGAFVGTLTLAGVTAGFAPNGKPLFGIMDLKELQCKSTTCNRSILPVRYQGKLPKYGDEVRVTGTFVREGDGYYFDSVQLKVVQNHKLGG